MAVSWASRSVNERRRRNVYYIQVIMPGSEVEQGWPAFTSVARTVRGMDPGKLAYRKHTVTPVGFTTVFEVLP